MDNKMVCGLNGSQMDKESLKEHLAMEKEITNGLLGTEMEIKNLKQTTKTVN